MAEKQSTKFPLESKVLPNPKAQPIMSLVISNVGGPNAGQGTENKRKKAIAGILKTVHPNVVLFQEFLWTGIRRHSTTGFSPLGRRCILEIKTKGVPLAHFLCISWHGSHNSKKETEIINELKNLLVFIDKIGNQMKLPFIIAGDFNLSYEKASAEINQHTVAIYEYTPLKRREGRLIDFYIASNTLPLADITAVDWETVESGEGATEIFDHDPVVATLMAYVPDPLLFEKRKSIGTNKLSESEGKSRKSQSN